MSGAVVYTVVRSIQVGEFLQSEGFDLATDRGFALEVCDERGSLGLLYKDPKAKEKGRLFGLIKVRPRRMFFGTIWFDSDSWQFEVNGWENVTRAKKLAGEMAEMFDVKILLSLVRQQPGEEFLWRDIDPGVP